MWNVKMYLERSKGKTTKNREERRELSSSAQVELTFKLVGMKRQIGLTKIDMPKKLRKLEESLRRLENCRGETELAAIGREVDLNSRDILLNLSLVIGYSNDFGCDKGYLNFLRHQYNRARELIQRANEYFGKYSGWPFDFFAKSAEERLGCLEEVAKNSQPYLLGAT